MESWIAHTHVHKSNVRGDCSQTFARSSCFRLSRLFGPAHHFPLCRTALGAGLPKALFTLPFVVHSFFSVHTGVTAIVLPQLSQLMAHTSDGSCLNCQFSEYPAEYSPSRRYAALGVAVFDVCVVIGGLLFVWLRRHTPIM